jgi:hypothetical protein
VSNTPFKYDVSSISNDTFVATVKYYGEDVHDHEVEKGKEAIESSTESRLLV